MQEYENLENTEGMEEKSSGSQVPIPKVDEILKKYGLTVEDLVQGIDGEDLSETAENFESSEELPKVEVEKPPQRKYADIFDSVEDLEKSYKNLQAEYTKLRQKIKPLESFIDLLQNNQEFAKFILDKSQEFFFGKKSHSEKSEEEDFDLFEEETKPKEKSLNLDEIRNIIRNEVNQVLTAQKMIEDFRRKYPDVTDEELVQIINHASTSGSGDLETSFAVLFKDKFIENLKRQALNEVRGHLKGQVAKSSPATQNLGQGMDEESKLWILAQEIVKNPRKLRELDPETRAKLLNMMARQLL